jgi:hypothetical protein
MKVPKALPRRGSEARPCRDRKGAQPHARAAGGGASITARERVSGEVAIQRQD